MANVEPLRALNLEPSQQQAFIRYYRSLPEKSSTTVRIFNRVEYFTVHGEDTKIAATEVFKTSAVIKTMGVDNIKLDYLVLSKSNFEKLVRELLLVKQYRCEVYVNQGSNKSNDWVLEYKGSPGNLSQFEEVLYENNEAISNSIVMAVKVGKNNNIGMSSVDANERIFSVCEFTDNEFFSNLESLLVQVAPRECLLQTNDSQTTSKLETILKRSSILCTVQKKMEFNMENICQDLDRLMNFEEGQQKNSQSLAEINMTDAIAGLHSVIKYLELTSDEFNFGKFVIKVFDTKRYVHMDSAAMSALNVLPKSSTDAKHCSLIGLLDNCRTPQGHRLMNQWIKQPLRDINTLNERLDVVEILINDTSLRHMLHNDHLRRIPDLLMLAKKIMRKKAKLQDCYRVYQGIEKLPHVIAALRAVSHKTVNTMLVSPMSELLEDMQNFQQMMETTLDMDLVDRGEFLVKPTFDNDLQELYKKKQHLEEKIQAQLSSVARDLGLDTGKGVKLDYTEQHTYFFRVTLKDEPVLREKNNYNIIGAIKGGVRFTTDKLDKLNENYNEIKDKYEQNQKNIVDEILNISAGYTNTISNINYLTAQLDVLVSYSQASASAPKPYIRPTLHEEGFGYTKLTQIRHPLLEVQDNVSFNPNDIEFKKDEYTLHIITGPNMGGKSTYIRSIGVAVLMAQIGCFVPCDEAEISLFDSILARVGSDDCQAKGLSTFMLEMVETAAILRTATEHSLVIIDELGRGTSTYEGCGIAWAIAEHLSKDSKSFSMFATHFHEITQLSSEVPTVVNKHVTAVVDEKENTLTLLYQVKPGICDQSFGIHVAKMAGFSDSFCKFATKVQHDLEDYRNVQILRSIDSNERQSILSNGDYHIKEALEKCKKINIKDMSEEDIKSELAKMKEELLNVDNIYIKTLVS